MEHGAEQLSHFSHWGAVVGIALLLMIAGLGWAYASVRAGQYKDPEAAKFDVMGADDYPAEADETPRSGDSIPISTIPQHSDAGGRSGAC